MAKIFYINTEKVKGLKSITLPVIKTSPEVEFKGRVGEHSDSRTSVVLGFNFKEGTVDYLEIQQDELDRMIKEYNNEKLR